MRNHLKLLWLGIVLLLIVLTINGYVTFLSYQRVNKDNTLVEHSQQIEGGEVRLRANRVAEMKAGTRSATLAFVIASSIAAAALLVFGGLLTREMRKSDAATAAVLEQKEWLDTTLRSIGDAVLATDTSGRVVFLNEVAAALTGHTSSEARGRPPSRGITVRPRPRRWWRG